MDSEKEELELQSENSLDLNKITPNLSSASISLQEYLEDETVNEKLDISKLQNRTIQSETSGNLSSDPKVEVVEKIIYKRERVHGFFRTLTLITLLFTGILMLLEGLDVFVLSIADINVNVFYPIFVILSVIIIWSYKGFFGKIFGLLMFLGVVAGSFVLSIYSSLSPSTINTTGAVSSIPFFSGSLYSKVYISTLINSLDVHTDTGSNLFESQYDAQRSLSLKSGVVQSGHTYILFSESNTVNLLGRVYTHLDIGLHPYQPLYLYIKTLLGQNKLDLQTTNIRGLRLHGGLVSRNVLWSTGSALGSALNNHSGVNLDMEAAVADVVLHIPKNIGVRIQYKSYLGVSDFPDFIQKNDNLYESKNINTATSILNINALFGLSRFSIVRDR